jgi:C-terminal processing protease CtpA/Prc
VGETTAGASNLVGLYRIDAQFAVFISHGRVVVPSTGGNWEGTGVHPDLAVPQGNALQTAHVAALKRVLEIADVATPDLARVVREEVRQGLAELERREADLSPEASQGEGTASPSCRLYVAFS